MKINLPKVLLLLESLFLLNSCKTDFESNSRTSESEDRFKANWESLSEIEREPDWFKAAKMGIYFHWGLYSVPAYDSEWFPRWMYVPGRANWGRSVYEHHKELMVLWTSLTITTL